MINELFSTFTDEPFIRFNFYKNGKPLSDAPFCGMSVRSAGSMRFRWNEKNLNRDEFLKRIAGIAATSMSSEEKSPVPSMNAVSECNSFAVTPVPVELIHSKIVYDVKNVNQTDGLQGDGIITANKCLMPVVTVADCMPIYLFEPESGVFGIVHSGWKGTGIIEEAIKLAQTTYCCDFYKENKDKSYKIGENFCVILGPHIRNCCYIVNQERADYFADNFGSDCITALEQGGKCYCGGRGLAIDWNNGGGKLYRLSLEKANLNVLARCGVKEENIVVYKDCTCCDERLGSNRRETALADANGIKKQPAPFTVQAAFIRYM